MQAKFIVIAINLIHLTAGQQNIIENIFFQDFAEWKVKFYFSFPFGHYKST